MKLAPPNFLMQGFTLPELMVSSAIGLLLLASIAQVYQFQSELYQLQSATEQVNENGAFARDFIGRTVSLAGFNIENDAPITSNSRDNNGSPNISDQIEIQFTSNGEMTDCQSALPITAGTRVRNRFYVQDGNLLCRSSLASSGQPLVEGVLQMQVQYGEDTDQDQSVNRYVTFNQIEHPDRILSARIALLVASTSRAPITPSQSPFQLLETSIPADQLPDQQQVESLVAVLPFARF